MKKKCVCLRNGTPQLYLLWRAMKMAVLLVLLGMSHLGASVWAQRMTIELKNASLRKVFEQIKQQTGYSFMYSDDDVRHLQKRDFQLKEMELEALLQNCLEGTGLTFEISDRVVVVKKAGKAGQEQKKMVIRGVVKDEEGEPLTGVTVLIKGTTMGVATDVGGKYELTLPEMKEVVLVFTFLGKQRQEVSYTGQQELNITLKSSAEEMDEVVVTGMFNRRKEGFTGSAVTVKGDELKKVSTSNIAKALATIDPSFRIMDDIMNGSNPNRLPDLRMRGQATLPGGGHAGASADMVALQGEYDTYPNKPLLIMDGFEIDLQTMVDLDPDRVESITLLKDAAATAIYGSRAANGVIVIESKTPKAGRLWVGYGTNVVVEAPDLSDYNLMNAAEKLEAERLAGMYDNGEGFAVPTNQLQNYEDKLREVKRGVNTYWLDKPLKTAVQQRHTLTLEGGDQALRYRLYVGYSHMPGVMKGSKRDVMTGSLDLRYRFKKVLLKNSITVDNTVGDESPWGSFSQYTRLNPYLRPYGENGEVNKFLDSFIKYEYSGDRKTRYANPMYNATLNTKNRTTGFTVRNLFNAEWNPNADLRLISAFSLSKGNGKTDIFRPAQHTAFDGLADPAKRGDYRRTQRENVDWELDLTASYNKLLAGVHYLTGNVRMSLSENRDENYGALVTGFPNENMDEILFGKEYNEKMTGGENTSRLVGGAATLGYSYNYKYSVDFSIRVDGSSVFGKDNRFAPFWAAGLRWDVKKEKFLSQVGLISDFILRGSYGVTGTQGFAPYQSRELYSYSGLLYPYIASDGTGVQLVAMPNDKLKWQQTDTWNIAAELGFLDGRITARAEYFQKLTKNSLTDITLAPSLGFASGPDNMGTLENKGMELNLSFIPYQNTAKNAYWTVTLNGSHNRDKLKKISEVLRKMNEDNMNRQGDSPLPHYEEGESVNRIWAVRSLGIDPLTGEEILLKRNGRMTAKYDVADLVPCGTTEPNWQGNVNSSFAWKGMGVDVSCQYKFGGQIYNQTLVDKVENADLMYNADKRVLKLRWSEPGNAARYKKITESVGGAGTRATSRFVMDENTFRMSSLSLSYRMDRQNAGYIGRWGLSSVKFAFNMEDLFYLSSVRQERGIDYPFARRFSFSLHVMF